MQNLLMFVARHFENESAIFLVLSNLFVHLRFQPAQALAGPRTLRSLKGYFFLDRTKDVTVKNDSILISNSVCERLCRVRVTKSGDSLGQSGQ